MSVTQRGGGSFRHCGGLRGEMTPVYPTLFINILILTVHQAGSTQTVTYQQHESAVLQFHFSHVSGSEGLHLSLMKMEIIDGKPEPSVICAFEHSVWVYWADHYKNRAEVLTDLSNGKLGLILKDVKKEDEGIYKCQAANEENQEEMIIRLCVTTSPPNVHYKVTEDTVTLYCESSSKGVTYEWRNSSRDLLSSEDVYTASPETLRINDTVTCIVRNKECETSSSLTIDSLPQGKAVFIFNPLLLIFVPAILVIVFVVCYLYSTRRENEKHNSKPAVPEPCKFPLENLQEKKPMEPKQSVL